MPSITLTPVTSYPGVTIKVNGTGFKKNQSIKMLIDAPKGVIKSYKCNTRGQFSGSVITGLSSAIGVHTVQVTSVISNIVLASAVFYLIVKPTVPGAVSNVVVISGDNKVLLNWGPVYDNL